MREVRLEDGTIEEVNDADLALVRANEGSFEVTDEEIIEYLGL